MTDLEMEDLNMTQARNELMCMIARWDSERGLCPADAIYLLKDALNMLEWQNREDAMEEEWRIN